MSRSILQDIIQDFEPAKFVRFFREKNRKFAETKEYLSHYDDEDFKNAVNLGEIKFVETEQLVVCAFQVSQPLSERSGKKAQYEKAKKILRDIQYDAGIFIFYDAQRNFRFSLIYANYLGRKRDWNVFRRFTYLVSREFTNKTFLQRIGEGDFSTLEKIKDAFSVEKVNKEFYNHIANFFYRLTGYDCKKEMTLPSVSDEDKKTYQEFAVRLIGRTIFCWFLKHKKSANGIPLIPESILSSKAVIENSGYYHSILEKLFFEVLNSPQEKRPKNILPNSDMIPFLNGGLFEPHDDFYSGKPLYNLVIPDTWFEQFFEILEQYNFTIDENSAVDADISVDPEMLGRIFENLLAEVNPETGETARKATGSYYTPRTIVDYMVDQSLKQYLISKTKIDEDRINALLSYEAPEVTVSENEKGNIISALDAIKIIDPACGSGAFPMGILHKMLLVLQKVDPDLKLWLKNHLNIIEPGIFKDGLLERIKNENWEYVRKLLIIQKSIYGVDIQTIAVEISKLRFFLSLIVEEQIDDLKNNRGVEALPNLEFKFVAANSLIGLPSVINRQVGLGIVNEEITRLKELRNKYLRSYDERKKQIEEDFLKTRGKLIEQNIKWGGKDALSLQLANWNPFSNETSEWFDPDWMFGIEDGFDIVIANPPYLGEKGHKELFRKIRQGTLKEYYQGKMDIFYFFFHLAINLGNYNSEVAFITTNYYSTAFGAKKLRQDFKKRTIIRKLVNFNELKIFESAQGQHNMLTILSKGHDDDAMAETCITKRKGDATPQTLQAVLDWQDGATNYYKVSQNDLYDGEECYIRLTGSSGQSKDLLQRVLEKMREQGEPLKPNFCDINNGIHTEADYLSKRKFGQRNDKNANVGDGIYILNRENKNDDYWIDRIENSLKERKYLKPFYKNSDIGKYWTNMNTQKSVIYVNKREDNINDLPDIKEHLSRFRKIIDASSDNSPYLHRPKNKNIFIQPKIVAPQRSLKNTFGYNEIPWYASADVYFITKRDESVDLKYCLALLNSNLYYLWLYFKGKRKGEALELYQVPLSEIPIKKIAKIDQEPFISIVDKILAITKLADYLSSPDKQAQVKEYGHRIDQMIYELYGLSPEEIAVVEGSTKY